MWRLTRWKFICQTVPWDQSEHRPESIQKLYGPLWQHRSSLNSNANRLVWLSDKNPGLGKLAYPVTSEAFFVPVYLRQMVLIKVRNKYGRKKIYQEWLGPGVITYLPPTAPRTQVLLFPDTSGTGPRTWEAHFLWELLLASETVFWWTRPTTGWSDSLIYVTRRSARIHD